MCGLISFYGSSKVNPTRSREKIILFFCSISGAAVKLIWTAVQNDEVQI